MRQVKIDAITKKEPEFHFLREVQGNPPIGISLNVARAGDDVKVARRAFFTDYDGDFFFDCLNDISNIFLSKWLKENRKSVSEISNCLIFLNKNNIADIFINCPTIMKILPKRSLGAGIPIYKEDIVDIRRIFFPRVEIPSGCAVIYIFSKQWRRGLYFDFLPLDPNYDSSTTTNFDTLFASLHAYLMFPEIHRLDPQLKEKMFGLGWFPFIRILGKKFDDFIDALTNGLPTLDSEMGIIDSFDGSSLKEMCSSWMMKDLFKKHESFLQKGIEEFIEEDYISSIHVLYPHIEGIMQSIDHNFNTVKKLDERLTLGLASYVKTKNTESTLFVPDDFRNFLMRSYFEKFDLDSDSTNLSRHSLAHGVAINRDDYSKIKAFQAILILDQIHFYV